MNIIALNFNADWVWLDSMKGCYIRQTLDVPFPLLSFPHIYIASRIYADVT